MDFTDPLMWIVAALSMPFVLAFLWFSQPAGDTPRKRAARAARAIEWDRLHGRGRENV